MIGTLKQQITRMIDISAVRANVTTEEIDMVARVAIENNFICAFTMPCYTPMLAEKLRAYQDILIGGVVGFPSGADTTHIKTKQAEEMVHFGVNEIDMVINVGALKSKEYALVKQDIKDVVSAAQGLPVKSILEIAYLTEEEITTGAKIAAEAGVTFVKTGTGWADKPTTVETIKTIKKAVGDSVQIKAAGGVRDLDTILAMIEEGCSRFGIGLYTALEVMQEVDQRDS